MGHWTARPNNFFVCLQISAKKRPVASLTVAPCPGSDIIIINVAPLDVPNNKKY